jgi:N,N'-diacetyllegionaminate synthase
MLKKYKNKTFIIAEAGINHNGNVDQAMKLIKYAKKAGADAVKFQTYLTEKRASKKSPIYEILKKCEIEFKYFKEMKEYSKELGIHFFSTPFDRESAEYLLKDLKLPLVKVASFYSSNNDLLEYISKYNADIIVSLGMTKMKEVKSLIKKYSKKNLIALLHCVTSYPNKPEDSHLSSINTLKKNFNNIIGYSDHTTGIEVPIMSIAAGAKIIEKHFMINKSDRVVDKAVSIDTANFKLMVKKIREAEKILGNNKIEIRNVEKKYLFLKSRKLN